MRTVLTTPRARRTVGAGIGTAVGQGVVSLRGAGSLAREVPLLTTLSPPVSRTSCWQCALRAAAVFLLRTGATTIAWSLMRLESTSATYVACVIACFFRHTAATATAPTAGRPTPAMATHTPAIPVAREVVPTRPLCCHMQPCCGCMEEGRRLAGPGLGSTAIDAVSVQTVGQSTLYYAAPSTPAVGGGGEWVKVWRAPRGPPEESPRPPTLKVRLTIIITTRRRAGATSLVTWTFTSIPTAPLGRWEEEETRGNVVGE